MSIFSFKTIEHPSEGLYKEKGSKFIALAFPVESDSEIKIQLEAIKKKYFDARHHCYAFVLGADKKKFRAFDDGEPNHSAGDPILGQIRSRELTNIMVVVVRYFGGTKLGVGGLVQAYKLAAEEALNKNVIVEKEVYQLLELHYPYTSTPEIMKLVKDFELEIVEHSFDDEVILKAKAKLRIVHSLVEKMELLKAVGHKMTFSMES